MGKPSFRRKQERTHKAGKRDRRAGERFERLLARKVERDAEETRRLYAAATPKGGAKP